MSANVETMFSVREKPWHRLGTIVEAALTSDDALSMAGLNWSIDSKPVYDERGNVIPGFKANTRSSDNAVMGIVSDKYQIVQNHQAFEFTDSLVGEGILYETAGSLRGGRQIWLLGKMPERYIVGDKFEPYICFTNTHDGSGSIKACMTPIRVVCNNTLNAAFAGAKRAWSTPHRGNVELRLDEARATLQLAEVYMQNLAEKAEKLAEEKLSETEAEHIISVMIALPENATDRMKRTAATVHDGIIACMSAPDLVQFANTKWGFLNAVSDYVGHADPVRKNRNWQESRWGNIIEGHPLFDKAVALVGGGV
jgi:phage/plasmid-like protein (TIGR03299 family)